MLAVRLPAPLGAHSLEDMVFALGLVVLALVLINVWMLVRLGRLSRSYARLMAGTSGGSLEQTLNAHLDRVAAAVARGEEASSLCIDLDRRLRSCVQHVGILRFDAFDDVGGRLSFALAMLDDEANGFVLSSLHGRGDTRLYAKPIREGQSEVLITAEEIEALRMAGFAVDGKRLVLLPDPGRPPRR